MSVKPYLKTISLCAAAAAAISLQTAVAGEVVASSKETKPLVQEAAKSCISGDIGVTFVTKYLSRGLVLEDQGVIAQPYADLYFKLYEGTGFINSVTAGLGIWSSIHSHYAALPGPSTTSAWYEFDYTPGITIAFAKNFTLTVSYFEFDSPSDSFVTARSINANLSFNDTDLLGTFALHPHFTVLREIDGAAGLAEDGTYFEVGIAPSFTVIKGTYPVTLTFPVNAGFGDDNFYAGDSFGYISAGGTVAVGLGCIPSCYGIWTATAGATYYHLGDNVAEATNHGKNDDWVGSLALGLTF